MESPDNERYRRQTVSQLPRNDVASADLVLVDVQACHHRRHVFVVWKVWTEPELGFALFWKLLIPSLPLLFAVAPGVWRQICPMAFVNQLPRAFGFSREMTLPVAAKNLAYFISVLAFFFLVSLRHIYFNQEPLAWMVLVFSALGLAFLGGVFFKGRSGWCGTFCPLAPIQKAYGHAPVVTVKNGYCPTCVGCQKN